MISCRTKLPDLRLSYWPIKPQPSCWPPPNTRPSSAALAKHQSWLRMSGTCDFLPSLVEVEAFDVGLLAPIKTKMSRVPLMPPRSGCGLCIAASAMSMTCTRRIYADHDAKNVARSFLPISSKYFSQNFTTLSAPVITLLFI